MGRVETAPARVPAGQLADAILALLPGRVSEFAPALGRSRTDNTIRARLKQLADNGLIECDGGVWRACETDPVPALPGYVFPDSFDDEARELFVVKIDELPDLSSFTIELLESYIRCLQRARLAEDEVLAAGLFHTSESGRSYGHPGLAIVREAERDAHVYREAIERRRSADTDPDQDDLDGL